jgi:hypothetical protein
VAVPGVSEGERLSNARYCINIARKLGACVFLIPEVSSRLVMTV